MICTCGHMDDEHLRVGDDPDAPNSTACAAGGTVYAFCDCDRFEERA